MAEFDYDLFVIGAGSGGVRAARIAAGYGAKVAVAEEFRVGGTCVIRGCVPKKLMVYASLFSEHFEDAAGYGWDVGESRFDWNRFVTAKDAEIDRLNAAYIRNLTNAGAELIMSRAVVEGPHAIRLVAEDRVVTARIILVATGGTPWLDHSIPGIEHGITSNEIFHLERFPERLVVAGAGYIAVEFAGIFNNLGTDVTLVHRGGEILRGFDEEVRTLIRAEMAKKGVKFEFSNLITGIEKGEDLRVSLRTGETLGADTVLFATGRTPNTAGLGLDSAGVELDKNGAVRVNHMSRSSCASIYAVGDVTDRVALTPVAIREGHAFADTVFGGKERTVDHTLIATAVFSQPELGTVGMTEAEAVAGHDEVDVYRSSFRPMVHTLSGRDERMLFKMLVDAENDRVLGVHIIGHGAAEMAQLIGVALKMGATKADFDATMAVHPTAAEELVTMRTPAARVGRKAA